MNENTNDQTRIVAGASLQNTGDYWTIHKVTNVLRLLFSAYYKAYIYRKIAEEVDNGTDPEHIVVFEKSILPDQFMRKMIVQDFEYIPINPDTIQFFQQLGSPCGFLPGKQIEDIREIFQVFEYLRGGFKDRPGAMLKKTFAAYQNGGDIDAAIRYMFDEMQTNGRDPRSVQRIKDKLLQNHILWKKFIYNENLRDFNSLVSTGEVSKKDLLQRKLYDRYYVPAFRHLANNAIPAVAIFDPKRYAMRFLGIDLFEDESNPYCLDLKSYSHNSPGVMEVIGHAIDWLPVIFQIYQLSKEYVSREKGKSFEEIITYGDNITDEERVSLRRYCMLLEENSGTISDFSYLVNDFIRKEIRSSYTESGEQMTKKLGLYNLIINKDKKIKVLLTKK